ncbi:MAG TPA: DUF3987 domain-containing protein [Dissulfurispiraceae bacterium]|nr:DUF3987 domain-containing protein [Dissulfurispiraceae bacterium]
MDNADRAQDIQEALEASVTKRRGRPPKGVPVEEGLIPPALALAAAPKPTTVFVEYRPEIEALLAEPPKPFIEPAVKLYNRDPMDDMLPKPGFVTDFVNTGRGMESPTLFFFWNAMWLLSTVLKREAWVEWYPDKLWPNLYVIIVAPPSLCRKSSSMKIANELLRALPAYMPNTLDAFKKESRIITGKTTPEGVLDTLAPDTKLLFDGKDGVASELVTIKKGSQAALALSEFAVFLGKQQYNGGMVTLLTDLFDCKDFDGEITRGKGLKPLEDIYVTMFGAITPDGLKMSIPEEAFGGGFMSRVVIAYQQIPSKTYHRPRQLPGYPSWQDLAIKLAWIAKNAVGEYKFTEEADKFFEEWYREWKASLFSRGMDRQEDFRLDSLVIRCAMLLRVQEYRKGNDITLDNVRDALRILQYTQSLSRYATEDVGASPYMAHVNIVKRCLQRRGGVTRRTLAQFVSSSGIRKSELTEIVDQLAIEGFLRIRLGDTVLSASSEASHEEYELMEDRNV